MARLRQRDLIFAPEQCNKHSTNRTRASPGGEPAGPPSLSKKWFTGLAAMAKNARLSSLLAEDAYGVDAEGPPGGEEGGSGNGGGKGERGQCKGERVERADAVEQRGHPARHGQGGKDAGTAAQAGQGRRVAGDQAQNVGAPRP